MVEVGGRDLRCSEVDNSDLGDGVWRWTAAVMGGDGL